MKKSGEEESIVYVEAPEKDFGRERRKTYVPLAAKASNAL